MASPSSVIAGTRDHWGLGEPRSSSPYCGLAVREPESPAVVVDHDRDVIRVVEGRRAAIEGGVVELPLRRGGPPDQLGELAPVPVVAEPAAFCGEVVLVPPLELCLGGNGAAPAAWLPIR